MSRAANRFRNREDAFWDALSEYTSDEPQKQAELAITGMRDRCFAKQLDYLDDPADKKALLCGRRAGKTYVIVTDLFITCLQTPNAQCAYVAPTRGTAKRLVWRTMKMLNAEFHLGLVFKEIALEVHFPNNAVVYLGGADTEEEIDKYRGTFYHKFVIDECGTYSPRRLTYLVEEAAGPALADYGGTMTLAGTPGVILDGIFYEATRPESTIGRPYAEREKVRLTEWSTHSWTAKDNEAMPHIWSQQERKWRARGWAETHPVVQREWYARWIQDNSTLVYRVSEANTWQPQKTEQSPWGLPEGHEWKFICGIDLGYDDEFALQVAAFSDTSDKLYHVYEFCQAEMTVLDIAREIQKAERMFGEFEMIVGDRGGLGKMVVAQLAEGVRFADGTEYKVAIETAEKSDKRDHIEMLNADFKVGRVFLLRDSAVYEQMSLLEWSEVGNKEKRGHKKDACDAFLYMWRHSMHYLAKEKAYEPPKYSAEWWDRELDRQEAEVAERERRRLEQDADRIDTDLDISLDGEAGYHNWRGYLQ